MSSNSPDHNAKGTPSGVPKNTLRPLVSTRFQDLFHSPPGVLFTFPSRYSFTIGHRGVFRLGGWSPQLHAEFHVFRATRDPTRGRTRSTTGLSPSVAGRSRPLRLRVVHPYKVVPQPRGGMPPRFGLVPVRSPLLGESRLISVPPGTEMFQFPGLAPLRVTPLTRRRVAPFGHPGITVCVPLPQAYRSLPRPSSPLDAKASTVCLIAFDLKIYLAYYHVLKKEHRFRNPHT